MIVQTTSIVQSCKSCLNIHIMNKLITNPFFRSNVPPTIQRKRQNPSTTKKRKYSKHKPSLGGKHPQNDYDPWRDIYQEGLFNNDAKEKTLKSDTSYHRSPGHEKNQKNNLNGITSYNIKTFCDFDYYFVACNVCKIWGIK